MKQWIGWVAIALFGGSISAAVVDAEKAAAVALAFAEQNMILAEHTEGVGEARSWENVWVVPLKPSGYVVVEMDDIRPPVIAFGKEDFPEEPAPPMADLLERPAVEEGLTTLSTLSATPAHEDWAILLEPSSGLETLAAPASPAPPTDAKVYQWEISDFTYAWTQMLPYNLYAPGLSRTRIPVTTAKDGTAVGDELSVSAKDDYGLRSPCGCVATSVSQVGAWFQWPYALRGVTTHEQEKAVVDDAPLYATYQVAAPGKPYDWATLDRARVPSVEEEDVSEEVGRFVQHWATLFDMTYAEFAGGGTTATFSRPDLLLLAGYKIVSPECVGGIMEDLGNGTWKISDRKAYEGDERKKLFDTFFKAIHTYGVPTATGISGHYIVCDGWAEEVDTKLSAETCYVKLNYGWSLSRGYTGWYALCDARNIEDGEEVADDRKIFLQESFTMLPLQCGEIVELSKVGLVPEKLKWYEAPYWRKNYRNAERRLQVVTFGESVSAEPRVLSLEAASLSDASWIYTPAAEGVAERLVMDPTRSNIRSAVLFPELLKRGDGDLSIEVGLERMTYKAPDGTNPTVPDEKARKLLFAFEDVETGSLFYTHELSLEKEETACTVNISADEVPAGKVFRVLLCTGASPADKGPIDIPVDSLAYAVTGVKVVGCTSFATKEYEFDRVMTESTQPGALTQGTLPTLAEAKAGETLWLAVTIDTGTPSYDALWKPLTIVANEEDAVALPTIAFEESRLFLNNLNTEIAFTMSNNIDNVTAYLSQGSWLMSAEENPEDVAEKVDYRNGFKLTPTEINNRKFTLADRAYTGTSRPDAMTLDSPETVGRDAVLSLCATDAVGNQAWTHVRLTWGWSDEIVALLKARGQELVTFYLDRLLFAALYAGCYYEKEGKENTTILLPNKDNAAWEDPTEDQLKDAMVVIEDAIRLGYASKAASEQETALSYPFFRNILLNGLQVFNPRVEVLSVSPTEITFKFVGDDATSSEALAQYAETSAITVEGGATLDAPLKEIEGVTLTDNKDGTYTLTVPDGMNFFQIKL